MRVGVVVLNWNGREWLEHCVPSVLATRDADVELYVADNGSEDDSLAWLADNYPHVRVVDNGANLRFAEGNNAGVRQALEDGCGAVLLLNNDATVEPDAIARMLAEFGDPDVGIVGPRIVYTDAPDKIWYGGGRAHLLLAHFSHRAIRRATTDGADPAGDTDWVTGCALLVRAEAWEALDGLDGSFYIYGEDADFSLRARAAGWAVRYCPSATVQHAVSASTGGASSPFRAYHQALARMRLARRHVPGPLLPLALMSAFAQECLLGLRSMLRGEGGAAAARWVAWFDAARDFNRYPAP